MPALPPTEKPVDAADLRPVRRYELGLVAFGETILAVIELEPSTGTTVQYAMSLAAAVTFCSDLTAMIESDVGITALVKATLADARSIKERGDDWRAPDRYLSPPYDASPMRDRRCGTCRATGRSPFAAPCPDCLAGEV